MTILCASMLFVAAVVYLVAVRLVFEERGYQRGHQDGYEAGRADESLWWMTFQKQVDQPQPKARPR